MLPTSKLQEAIPFIVMVVSKDAMLRIIKDAILVDIGIPVTSATFPKRVVIIVHYTATVLVKVLIFIGVD